MCDELPRYVEWVFNAYSAVLGLSTFYVFETGEVLVELHYSSTSKVTGGVPVGVVLRGSGRGVSALCSLPAEAPRPLPLLDPGDELLPLENYILLKREISCNDIYNQLIIFIVKCGLLYKGILYGGNIENEFREIMSRL
ncbi:MAG: hypothetical protein TU35_001120 [Thermoproteus sp. AZ2]|uniref:Uncharacterized protein n=1 Tax=Thermoproteus sp. AZ2 TaxID=1609232 RepID=A0ACC6UYF1_9CREN|nr:MAG: hypothetical protein TU35_00315 [Thermoproteus sp. AZ2]